METCSSPDYADVILADDDARITDDEIIDAWELCSDANTGGWRRRVIDVSRFAGQERELQIAAYLDEFLNSNWFIDDVSLQVNQPSHIVIVPTQTPNASNRETAPK